MRPQCPDIRRLVEVARLYYESGLTQAAIARRLGTSRPGVQRMIRAARESGIVTIAITDPLARPEEIRRGLEATFGLKRAVVVPGVPGDPDATKTRVGEAGGVGLDFVVGAAQHRVRPGGWFGATRAERLNHEYEGLP